MLVRLGPDARLVLTEVPGVGAREILVTNRPIKLDDLRAAPPDPRATFGSAREWRQGVDCRHSRFFGRVMPMLRQRTFTHRRLGSRQVGGSGSFRLTHRQAQAREEKLSVLRIPKRASAPHYDSATSA